MQTFFGLSRIPPHERLLNGPVTSVRGRLAFVFERTNQCLSTVKQIAINKQCNNRSSTHEVFYVK